MKTSLTVLSLILPFAALGQVPNAEFENWTWFYNLVEEPDGWKTNNINNGWYSNGRIPVAKTTDSYSGPYAMEVANNAASFEGPPPGYATTVFITNDSVTKISAYVKCDYLYAIAKGIISVSGYSGGLSSEIGRWETNVLIPQYTLVEIPTPPLNSYDSVRIKITAHADMGPTGWPYGYIHLKVDQMQLMGCSPMSLSFTTAVAKPPLNNGAMRVIASGGTPPYLYSLDSLTFQAGNTFTSLALGTYPVYVADDNGCTTQGTFTIDETNCNCATR